MYLIARARLALRVHDGVGLALLYIPLALVVLNAFNTSRTFAFPPTGLHAEVVARGRAQQRGVATRSGHSVGPASARRRSLCVLGTMAAFAVAAVPVLRPVDDQLPGRAADRAARASSPGSPSTRVHQRARPARHRLRADARSSSGTPRSAS